MLQTAEACLPCSVLDGVVPDAPALADQTIIDRKALMTMLDLAKATLVCGGGSFLIYSFPVLGQIIVIGVLGLLWLLYARKALEHHHR